MSPRRKRIKKWRLYRSWFRRNSIPAEDIKFPADGMIGRIQGVQFIKVV